MYECYYKYIKREYDAQLLFTDTGSLAYEIKTEKHIYEIVCKNKNLFDFSNYLNDSMLYDLTNMNKIGKMKDKSEGKTNIEFLGLKSKMYLSNLCRW